MKKKIYTLIISLYSVTMLSAIDLGSPLLNAVDEQNFEEVVKLVNAGAKINQKNSIGFTPLLIAAGWGDVKMVKFLINHGASFNIKSNRFNSIVYSSSQRNYSSSILKSVSCKCF